ncbi:MAG TPA: hypothetical protein VJR46_09860 [Candidatus Dormibacteraeota bacterium]|nr:hypothetical protein [Candidatus Dormibacteraeota bacterium]
MEARQTLTGTSVPKGLMIVLAVGAAIALAAMGGYITRSLGGSSNAVVNVGHPAPGTVLRQDNPPVQGQSQISAPVGSHDGRSSGTQIENSDFGFTADGEGYQSDLTRVLPTETQGYNPGWDARSVREGHGA